MSDTILRVDDLHAYFFTNGGVVKAVNGITFAMRRGRTLAISGESGAGKTTVALAILNLLPYPGRIVGGRVYFDDTELTALSDGELRGLRGRDVSMIFQDPISGLNPVLPVGVQVAEIMTAHLHLSKGQARRRTLELLAQVGLPDPAGTAESYPFHLSGGMCQRVMIAIATALQPKLLIADEPTSALDVTVQASILHQLSRLKDQQGMSILLITHDLGVVAQMADDVAIMYAGSLMELASVEELFRRPLNPYTWALMASRPRLDRESRKPLPSIRGSPPDMTQLSEQCPFLARCNKATVECRTQPAPPLVEMDGGHYAACYNPIVHWAEGEDEEA